MEMDRLSALPDCLLLLILNRLYVKEAAKSAALSKQWRYLWTNLPFRFSNTSAKMDEIQSFVATVHPALSPRRGPALKSLVVSFNYDERLTPDVDSWVHFAAKNKVEVVSLYLLDPRYDHYRRQKYNLPQIIYSNPSLKQLHLERCTMEQPPLRVEWRRLKTLRLKFVVLSQQAIEEIVSGCPLLETLELVYCEGFNRLEIGGRSLHYLQVEHYGGGGGKRKLEISAPYVRDLTLVILDFCCGSGSVVQLENVASLGRARIDFCELGLDSKPVELVKRNIVALFQDIGHVEDLSLSNACTAALSIMERNGWQPPQVRVKYLDIEASSCELRNIYGVVAMLESSPYVEELVIYGYNLPESEEFINWGPTTRDGLKCDLLHLKTVKLVALFVSSSIFGESTEFISSDFYGEPTLTLAQILLKRAPFLEKMVIACPRDLSTEEIDLIKRKLLDYPKSYQNVSVEIRH